MFKENYLGCQLPVKGATIVLENLNKSEEVLGVIENFNKHKPLNS